MDPPAYDSSIEDIVTYYHHDGYTNRDILGFLLFTYHVSISLRTLERIKRRLSLRRRLNESPMHDIVQKILQLQENGFGNCGYKTMWRILNTRCGLRATQETVRRTLLLLNRDQVVGRRRRVLRRREYINRGPNCVVHIDGYDKLKPYGICIHGAICGFSRKILWLKACPSNKNPRYVASFFMDYIKKYGCVPRLVRADRGTEHSILRDLQISLRFNHGDSMAGFNSFQYGRSTANQRIEMLWSFLSRTFTGYWRNLFLDLIDQNVLDNSDRIHVEIVRYCFMPVIQKHLDVFAAWWNGHRIRSQRRRSVITDIPDVMFHQPYVFGTWDQSFPLPCSAVQLEDITRVYTEAPPTFGCSEEFLQLIEHEAGIQRGDIVAVKTGRHATALFLALVDCIQNV